MRNLPKEKLVGTEGLIKQLEAKIASLEQRVTKLQEETTKKNISTVPNVTEYGSISSAINANNGIARYIDVDETLFVRDNMVGGIAYSSVLGTENVVWDAVAGCFKFYGVYKE